MKKLLIFFVTLLCSYIAVAQTKVCDSDSIVSYLDVDEIPKFQSQKYNTILEYVYSNLQYPNEIDVQGKVIVSFVVAKNGKIGNAKIEKQLCNECDKEVIRILLSMSKWSAGKKNGKKVNTQLLLIVNFKLESEDDY